jgi:hypothetical protein
MFELRASVSLPKGDNYSGGVKVKTYQKIASLLQAIINCQKSSNQVWQDNHTEAIETIMQNSPSGSGFDNGTSLDFFKSTPEKLVFNTAFHHMDENGFYDGWSKHEVIITPSLAFGFNIRVTGRDRNEIKDYIAEMMDSFLNEEI